MKNYLKHDVKEAGGLLAGAMLKNLANDAFAKFAPA